MRLRQEAKHGHDGEQERGERRLEHAARVALGLGAGRAFAADSLDDAAVPGVTARRADRLNASDVGVRAGARAGGRYFLFLFFIK